MPLFHPIVNASYLAKQCNRLQIHTDQVQIDRLTPPAVYIDLELKLNKLIKNSGIVRYIYFSMRSTTEELFFEYTVCDGQTRLFFINQTFFVLCSNAHEKVPIGKPPLLRARTLPTIIVPRLNITAPIDEDSYDGPFGKIKKNTGFFTRPRIR